MADIGIAVLALLRRMRLGGQDVGPLDQRPIGAWVIGQDLGGERLPGRRIDLRRTRGEAIRCAGRFPFQEPLRASFGKSAAFIPAQRRDGARAALAG